VRRLKRKAFGRNISLTVSYENQVYVTNLSTIDERESLSPWKILLR
jgi:hypothetical protein